MADAFSLLLWSLAEYFNYTAVALIILCSTLMTVFIISQCLGRLNGDHWGHYHNRLGAGAAPLAEQKDVVRVVNPFSLRMAPVAASPCLSDGVWVQVSCLQASSLHVYWGAAINPVHAALLTDGQHFLRALRCHTLLQDKCLVTEEQSLESCGKHQVHLQTPPAVAATGLGPPPRSSYPCVVVMTTAQEDTPPADSNTVVAMVTVLHLKDDQCGMATHIIAQYAKMNGPAVYNLQPLFFASDADSEGGEHSRAAEAHPPPRPDACQSCGEQTTAASAREGPTHETNHGPEIPQTAASSESADSASEHHPCLFRNRHRNSDGEETESSTNNSNASAVRGCNDQRVDQTSCSTQHHHDLRQESQPEEGAVFAECIVCQNQPLNCVLLPCRHACVCSSCFQKLERCPMCRSHVESYFTLRDCPRQEEIEAELVEDLQPLPMDLYSRFERFNVRLNRYLGFE